MKLKKGPKIVLIILVLLAFIFIGSAVFWMYLASPVDTNDKRAIEVVIPEGATASKIGTILKEKDLIKNEMFFKIYLKFNKKSSLKATTYVLKKNMSLDEIISALEKGNDYNPDVIKITFKEGKRLTEYVKLIAENTNHTESEIFAVIDDKDYVKNLISKYWFLTDSILDENIYHPLEGYLFPETYYFLNKDVKIEDIIEKLLDEMSKRLEPYKDQIKDDPHKYITLASIAELEGTNEENRKMIVGIFNNRIAKKMTLGSDVTTYYAFNQEMDKDLTKEMFNTYNPYNTRSDRLAGLLPVGPICSPGESSIKAAINPTSSDYYYFVADKYANIYYTITYAEHEAKVREIKAKGDWIW